jgi:hypothetical protein
MYVFIQNQKIAKDGHQHGCSNPMGLAEFAKLAPARASFEPCPHIIHHAAASASKT